MKLKILTLMTTVVLLVLSGCGGGGGSNDGASGGGESGDTMAPKFITPDMISVQENHVNVMRVHAEDTATVTYGIGGGEDSDLFMIDHDSGLLTFIRKMDFENPADTDKNNIYSVTVTAKDSHGNTAQQHIAVTITDIDDTPPTFTSRSSIIMNENYVNVVTLHANDDSSVNYRLKNGEDASLFIILNKIVGELRFKTGPDFEKPVDGDMDNVYHLIVTATDSEGNQAEQRITVTVEDIEEDSNDDTDDDRIPDNIEVLIGSDPGDDDINQNGLEDGLDTEGVFGDTFFDMQWHIRDYEARYTNNSGVETTGTSDLDVMDIYHNYMGYNKGENIVVQIVDTGVDADHEDLSENMDLSLSYDGASVGDPSANTTNIGYTHGTMVAGIMAARAFNGKGVRGIVPFAKIAGSNWLESQGVSTLEKVWLTDGIAVVNNSWGVDFDTDTIYEDIMERGVKTLREGKGKIYVFAAGNSRGTKKNANLQYSLNNRFAIAVAALKNDNTHADYSTPGSNILVSGYSGNYYDDSPTIGTTTVMGKSSSSTTWAGDMERNYTFAMNGTSAASPTVAASIALVLEACPDLTWRDIRYLIAKNAVRVDSGNTTWKQNSVGLWHSIDYGFGLINAKGMIAECTNNYTLLPEERNTTASKTFNRSIADNDTVSFTLNVTDNFTVEWIEVTVDNDNQSAEDYKIKLISPNGSPKTETVLMTSGTGINGAWMNGGFRFGTPAMTGEASQGIWTIEISDEISGNTGTVDSIQITIYGH